MNNNTGDNIPLYIRKKKTRRADNNKVGKKVRKNQIVKSTYTAEQLKLLKIEFDIERKQKGFEAYCRLREQGNLNITPDMINKESNFGEFEI